MSGAGLHTHQPSCLGLADGDRPLCPEFAVVADPATVFPAPLLEARMGDLLLGSVWLVAALALVVLGAATAHDGSRNG